MGPMMVEPEKTRELVTKSLKCWASFERLVADLYDRMANKVTDEVLTLMLKWLSTESRSHSTYLENLSVMLEDIRENGCAEFIGIPWFTNEGLLREVSLVEHLDLEMALDILRKLQSTEKLASEEVYSVILSNLLKDLVSFVGIEAEPMRLVFEEISMQEKYHEKIVELLTEHISRKLSKL
ncbi:MAG: hypothetical protein QW154_03150 [Sulfolobales archaeon]